MYTNHMLADNGETGCRVTRGQKKLHQIQPNMELYRKLFSFIGSKERNSLEVPESIRNIQSPGVFRQSVRHWSTTTKGVDSYEATKAFASAEIQTMKKF